VKKAGLVGVTVCLLALAAAPRGNALDWPRWRGPEGTGISREANVDPGALAGGAKVLWTVDIGAGFSSAAVSAARLFTAGTMEGEPSVQCLDAATGSTLWKRTYEDYTSPQSTPAVDEGKVYALASNGLLLCLQAADGEVVWQRDLAADFGVVRPSRYFAASPVVDGGLLLVNGNTALLALDKATGREVWSRKEELPRGSWGSYASPVACDLDGRRAALFLGPSRLSAIDMATGTVLWSVDHEDRLHAVAEPIVADGAVFYALSDVCGLLPLQKGAPARWTSPSLTTWLAGPVLRDGFIYGTSIVFFMESWNQVQSRQLPFRCVEWKSGKVAWENPMKNVSVTAAGQVLFLLELTGTLHMVEADPASYRELGSADVLKGLKRRPRTFATPPVLANGLLYCRNFAGDLVCIDVRRSQ
jgi:outer membrane protein assembly factor BamB